MKAIAALRYRVIVISPEQIMKLDGEFERLLKNQLFVAPTFTKHTLGDITRLLHMHHDKTIRVYCSSDQPNIEIGIRKIKYVMSSFADLAFLIPDGIKVGNPPPPKFLIFFDDIPNSIAAMHMM
ncbi:hypothetical protein BDN67DRAFT_991270 [Paxillus ammoniavirescens]|nr:hypothetical protein BDN67DRAFT_991270 [Paxillus ammoniavirescens]